ncbi:MAG: hypothetical protein AAF378_25835, partial [Cyanobacteria bacterium P01_A01_bin.84]
MSKKIVDNGKSKVRLTPLEEVSALYAMLQINLQGRSVGGYILRKGSDKYLVQFGFECKGIHPTLRTEQIDKIFDAIESGLKDLPQGERLTIHLNSFTDDTVRQQDLENLSEKAEKKELQYLLMGERCRIQQLTNQGVRKPKNLYLYCTYTVESTNSGTSDLIERILSKVERKWKSFTGEISELQFTRIENLIQASFTEGYQLWEQLISNKMGLDILPLNAQKLWENLWQRFNNTPTKPIPQLMIFDENGLREEVYSDIAATSYLMESESSVPIADKRWVHLKDKYIGALT